MFPENAPRPIPTTSPTAPFVSAVALCLVTTLAFADDAPRKIDFSTVITNEDGKPFLDCMKFDDAGKCAETIETTLGRLAATGLSERFPDEKNFGRCRGCQARRASLRVHSAKEVELTVDEIEVIKDCIAKLNYRTTAVYQAWKLLVSRTTRTLLRRRRRRETRSVDLPAAPAPPSRPLWSADLG